LINKVGGKDVVIQTIIKHRSDVFTIAIVDKDKVELSDFFAKSRLYKEIKVEYGYVFQEEIEIFKIEDRPLFIIQVSPIEFEKWINTFLINSGTKIENFEFESLKEFEENHCKKHLDKLKVDKKFKKVMKFVLDNYKENDNSINRLQKALTYLIEENYTANVDKLKEILN
jgi:hypothetical protein